MLKIIMIIGLLMSVSEMTQAEIYKWTDKNGVVHYGDKNEGKSEVVDIVEKEKVGNRNNINREERRRKLIETYDIERKEKKEKQDKFRKKKAEMNAQCGYAKDRLRRYKRAGSLYDVDKNGNRTNLSDGKRKLAISKLQRNINKYCN